MEGASWIARKAHVEIERHIQKLHGVMGEYSRKFKDCVIDDSIAELNGREVLKINQWLREMIDGEVTDLGGRYEAMFENVNYHLAEANRNYA
jgi:hypothetical protein